MTLTDMHKQSIVHVSTRFQLIDEQGAGEPYAGLAFEAVDGEGGQYSGYLDATGSGVLSAQSAKSVVVRFSQRHEALHITELQVRAEHTRYVNKDGARTRSNPTKNSADTDYYQVEVRHLVEHVSHLPPVVECDYPLDAQTQQRMHVRGQIGVRVTAGRCTVLQVRPLRALSLMLSTATQLCALNLYQMALMATQGDCTLDVSARAGRYAYRPLYEDVAYSSRFQAVPTATAQVFMAHNDDALLITVHEPRMVADFLRDTEMHLVPFAEGEGNVHRGFYLAAQQAYACVDAYLDTCHAGQKVLMCGHGLSGAVALILCQMVRNRPGAVDVQLYTYGSPKSGDTAFVRAAQSLVHYRMVNHHDPMPSMPGSWMSAQLSTYAGGPVLGFVNVPPELGVFVAGLSHLTGELYQHHGTLCHFMPVELGQGEVSQVMWSPTSDIVTQHALSRAVSKQVRGLPECDGPIGQLIELAPPFGVNSYIPSCWVALRRSQAALEAQHSSVAEREVRFIDQALEHIAQQLRGKYHQVVTRPSQDVSVQERSINLLMRELCRLHTTRKRLCDLRLKVPSPTDVYGECVQQPQVLAQSLERWLAGDASVCSEPLAVASAS